MIRSSLKFFLASFLICMLSACGGGGGGDASYGGSNGGGTTDTTNSLPTITNSVTLFSVRENETDAFAVLASDSDGDSLEYSLSGGADVALFAIDTAGNVTFNMAPDFESPNDTNADNEYELEITVSDGTGSTTSGFTVTVTNDTSEDTDNAQVDGVLIRDGYVQSATVCIPVTDAEGSETCAGATYTTTTNLDGSFSLEYSEAGNGDSVRLLAVEGFNAVTGDSDAFAMTLNDAVVDQNIVISPLSTLLSKDSRFTFNSLKEKLGIDSNFMIRFDDPYQSPNDSTSNKASVVNTQLLILYETLSELQTLSGLTGDLTAVATINEAIFNREASSETSLGDTTLVREIMLNLDLPDYTLTNEQLENLSGGLSSFLQKIYVNANNEQAYFAVAARDYLLPTLKDILDNSFDSSEVDQLTFETLQWVTQKTARTDLQDVENFATTTYSVGNSGSAYYTIDGINADTNPHVIYARVGDTIVFESSGSSVFASHPFEISTSQNDTQGTNNIGSTQGWNQATHTLTISENTPKTLYPHCGVHAGMYTNGKIEVVTAYDQASIDITAATSELEVAGTVSVGPYIGASGNTHTVYLRAADAGSDYHTHEFRELPGITFYMPAGQGYHGATESSGKIKFKTKSHF